MDKIHLTPRMRSRNHFLISILLYTTFRLYVKGCNIFQRACGLVHLKTLTFTPKKSNEIFLKFLFLSTEIFSCLRFCLFYLLFKVLYMVEFRSSRPEVFCKKSVFKSLTKFTGKHLYQSHFFFKKTLLKKRLCYWRFPVNFMKFLRTLFLTEHLWWLLLKKLSGNAFNVKQPQKLLTCHF